MPPIEGVIPMCPFYDNRPQAAACGRLITMMRLVGFLAAEQQQTAHGDQNDGENRLSEHHFV